MPDKLPATALSRRTALRTQSAVACRLGFAATACSSFRSIIAISFDFCPSLDFVHQVVLHFLWPDFLQGFALLCYRSEKVRVISEIGNVFNPFGKIGH